MKISKEEIEELKEFLKKEIIEKVVNKDFYSTDFNLPEQLLTNCCENEKLGFEGYKCILTPEGINIELFKPENNKEAESFFILIPYREFDKDVLDKIKINIFEDAGDFFENIKPLEVNYIEEDGQTVDLYSTYGNNWENSLKIINNIEKKIIEKSSEEEKYNQMLKEKEKMSFTDQIDYLTKFLDDIRENSSQDEVKEFLDTLSEMVKHKQDSKYFLIYRNIQQLDWFFSNKISKENLMDFKTTLDALSYKAQCMQQLDELEKGLNLNKNNENFEEILAKKADEMGIDKEIVDEYLNKNQKPQQESTAEAPAVKIKR